MKKQPILFLLLIFTSTISKSQDPTLVTDFYPGAEDAFSRFNIQSEYLGEKIIFPIENDEIGQELGIIENNEFRLLKDIYEGAESSEPKEFTKYENVVYFSAKVGDSKSAIWSTDGTEDGTIQLVEYEGDGFTRPMGLTLDSAGVLYYSYDNNLFRYENGVDTLLLSNVSYSVTSNTNHNFTVHKGKFAFLQVDENDLRINLYEVDGTDVNLLGSVPNIGFFSKVGGLYGTVDGYIFTIYDSFDSDLAGNYLFDIFYESIDKFSLGGSNEPIARHAPINDSITLAMARNKGFYATTGWETDIIWFDAPSFTVQGEALVNTLLGDKLLFYAESSSFPSNDRMVITDGSRDGTSAAVSNLQPYLSNIVRFGNYAFFADGTSNGFDPKIYYVKGEDGTSGVVHEFSESSLDIGSVYVLGVQNNRLYFASNLDGTIGRELYSIELNIPGIVSSNEQIEVDDFYSFKSFRSGFSVDTKFQEEITYEIYNVSGQRVQSGTIRSNEFELLQVQDRVLFFKFKIGGKVYIEKTVNF